MLQAFIDDSISNRDDKRLFLAGYLGRAESWRAFVFNWRQALLAEPSIRFLHMVEAQNLRGEFAGWTPEARDAKILALARLIQSFEFFSFECSLSTEDHKKLFSGRTPFGLARAYSTALCGVTTALVRYVHEFGGKEPIHFVFDTQEGADKDVEVLWPWLKLSSSPAWRDLLGPTPRFASDLDEVALQAADMLAWHRRREHEGQDPPGSRPSSDLLISEPHLTLPIDTAALADMARKMARIGGVKSMLTKKQWRETRLTLAAHQQAGLGPPRFGPRTTYVLLALRRPSLLLEHLHAQWRRARGVRAKSARDKANSRQSD